MRLLARAPDRCRRSTITSSCPTCAAPSDRCTGTGSGLGYWPASFLALGGGINITLQSYVDYMCFGFMGCPQQTGDLSKLVEYMHEALDETLAAAEAVAARAGRHRCRRESVCPATGSPVVLGSPRCSHRRPGGLSVSQAPGIRSRDLVSATRLREAAVMEHSPDLVGLETAEGQLQQAVRSNDVADLSELLHDELLAVAPAGGWSARSRSSRLHRAASPSTPSSAGAPRIGRRRDRGDLHRGPGLGPAGSDRLRRHHALHPNLVVCRALAGCGRAPDPAQPVVPDPKASAGDSGRPRFRRRRRTPPLDSGTWHTAVPAPAPAASRP